MSAASNLYRDVSEPINLEDHEGLVRKEATHWRWASLGNAVSEEDLLQEGRLGLLRAASSFDASRGFRFSTYAVPWIRHYIRHAAQCTSRTVRIPAKRAHSAWASGDPYPTTATSLDVQPGNPAGNGPSLLDLLGHVSNPDHDEQIDARWEKRAFTEALSRLPERERLVLRRVFFEGRDLGQIGKELKVSRERTRQIKEEALAHLRDELEDVGVVPLVDP